MPDDALEKLKKKIYGQSGDIEQRTGEDSSSLKSYAYRKEGIATGWTPHEKEEKTPLSRNTKIILAFSAFAITAITLAVVYLFSGFVGNDEQAKVLIMMTAPESVGGGDRVLWKVEINNKTALAIASADLVFEYPKGSRPLSKRADNPLSRLLIERFNVGHIAAGEQVTEEFEAFVFGDAESIARAHVSLEYRFDGSSALLAEEASFSSRIIRTPASVAVALPQYANIGQEIQIEVIATSDAKDKMENMSLVVNYPDGFQFISAEPKPTSGNNTWNVDVLNPRDEKRYLIKGNISGASLENKVFKASLGVKDNTSAGLISYGSGVGSISLRKPFLDMVALVNDGKATSVQTGRQINVVIQWSNNLPTPIKNAVLEVKLDGAALDMERINIMDGYLRGSDNTVIWNASSNKELANIGQGQAGEVSFNIYTLKSLPIKTAQDVNFQIKLTGHMYLGERPAGFEGVDIDGRFESIVKIESSLQLSRQGYYYSDIIPNSGPVPPKVGKKTTYTAVWSLTNSSNNADNVVISSSLPAYISWEGKVSPEGEDLTYDSATGKLAWNVGKVLAGTGVIRAARQVAFQIGIVPSLDQVGAAPVLVDDIVVEGKDLFTGTRLKSIVRFMDTSFYNDTRLNYDQFDVVK
jgi:hypothetical protein